MKKRLLALLCVLVLTLSASLTAFAMPSREGGRIEAEDSQGNQLGINKIEQDQLSDSDDCDHGEGCNGTLDIVTPVTDKYKDKVDDFVKKNGIKDLIKDTPYAGKNWQYVFELEVVAKGCVHLPVTLILDPADWVEGKPLIAIYDIATGTWKLLDIVTKDGKYTLTIDQKNTPMVFFLEKDAIANPESPKTADPIAMGAVMMAAGLAGLGFVAKKRED